MKIKRNKSLTLLNVLSFIRGICPIRAIRVLSFLCAFAVFCAFAVSSFAQDTEPVVVHGDQVEYFPDKKQVIGTGNVVVDYKGARLTADQMVVHTQTQDGFAVGNVTLIQDNGIFSGDMAYYNFKIRKGTVTQGSFSFPPLYGKGEMLDRVLEEEFQVRRGYITTCEKDPPHYRLQAKKILVYLDDKVVANKVIFYVHQWPILFFPRYSHSLREDRPHILIIPGKQKPWGYYTFTFTRFEINENAKGNIRLDYREKWGESEGVDYKYRIGNLGGGILKTYYAHQRDRTIDEGKPAEFERQRVTLRHRWEMDKDTLLTLDYNRFSDANFRRDYFRREEFEKEPITDTVLSVISTKERYTSSLIVNKRVNRFDSTTERLPEIKFALKEQRIGESNFYYKNESSFASLTNKFPAPTDLDDDANRIDIFNELSYSGKLLGWLNVRPFARLRETYYNKGKEDTRRPIETNLIRGGFSPGFQLSTKFYRIFDVKTDLWDLEIDKLRHIVTPTIDYTYHSNPTVPASKLQQFDGIDSISRQNSITLSLENKLQTKRPVKIYPNVYSILSHDYFLPFKETETTKRQALPRTVRGWLSGKERPQVQSVDLLRFIVSIPYDFQLEDGTRWGNLNADLELLPYHWLRIESDATYNPKTRDVETVNVDIVADRADRWYFGLGSRYQRNSKHELTYEWARLLTPKIKFRMYGRYDAKEIIGGFKRINKLAEQEYVLAMDLHCWIGELTYNVTRDRGEGIFFVFRLKAFPEVPIDLEQQYHRPKIGSQSHP